MRKHLHIYAAVLAIGALASHAASASPIQWTGPGSNGHFYDFVDIPVGTPWTDARDAAAGMTHAGVSGHLATITSSAENAFIASTFADPDSAMDEEFAWIGASDNAAEGVWKWVVGPEAGTQFWQGGPGGAATAPFNFANWWAIEPNDDVNEDYGLIGLGTTLSGLWSDAPDGTFNGTGYIVEFSTTTAVPAPSSALCLVAGLAGLAWVRGRFGRRNRPCGQAARLPVRAVAWRSCTTTLGRAISSI